jgi:hypothetical protein
MPPRKRDTPADAPADAAARPLPRRGSLAGPVRPRRRFVPVAPVLPREDAS